MNWGKSIVLAFILFGCFIGYMVMRAFQENFDLVTEDYYAEEINYQQKLDKLSAASRDGQEVQVKQDGDKILLVFPNENVRGTIQFYHPSRKLFDRKYEIKLEGRSQRIDRSDLVAGNYRVNISWDTSGKEYYQESKLYIQ